jgi:TonB-linked SusC/RagA family outer membrane protein
MKKFLLTCSALVFVLCSWAQERTLTGRVTSVEDGSALPGVNVVVKGTTNGTVTDADGAYNLSVSGSNVSLVFSFIGLSSQEVAVGERSVVDIQMALDVTQLTEVVVTAVGITREKKALGYSVASVSSDNIAQRSEPDPLRALQGKMAGVNIGGTGGAPGQSTKINIRGASSFTGNTQPLFVVDGIPFDNSVNGGLGGAAGSSQNTVYSNRAFDIDPNNIESLTILKGAAASALYGSRATNGVVVITTKAGKKGVKKGVEVTYNGSVNIEEISGIPEYQDVYTQGSNQVYNGGFIGNWGAPFPDHVDAINAQYGTNYSKVYGLYPDNVPYPDGTAPNPINNRYPNLFPEYVQQYTRTDNGATVNVSAPYKIEPHDIIGGFFNKGQVVEHALSVSSGTERASINAGFSRMDNEGIIPNSDATRTTLSFGGNGQLENGLFLSGTVNYAHTTQQSPQSGGSAYSDYVNANDGFNGASMYSRLFYLPRNFDLNGLPFEHPVDGSNIFYRALDNPLWIAKYNLYSSDVNRVYGNITAGYDITPWLNVLFKGGVNTYSESRRNIVRAGGISIPAGQIWTEDLTNTEQDYNLIVTLTKDFGEDFNVRAMLGYNANQREYTTRKVTGTTVISTGLNRTDATSTQIVNWDYSRLRRLNGLYADISLSFRDYLFLNLVGRNDKSSTLPESNNSYFYPGASVSLILSEVLEMPSFIDNLKVRAGLTKVGNDPDPYLTGVVYNISVPFTTTAGVPTNRATLSNTLGNPNLKPEFTTEAEGGIEASFFDSRIKLDLTYFSRVSTDQIASATIARSSGFTQEIVNVGELTNKGWEIGLDLTPVKLGNGFTWNSYVAFTKIKSEVVDAGPTGEIFIGGPLTSLGTMHRNGNPYGQIFGTRQARDANGNTLIDPNTGLPFAEASSTIIGDPNPDFQLGWTNTFSFKGITLSALLDWKQGGDFYSFTAASLLLRGQLEMSIDREALRVVPGVLGSPQTYEPILDDTQQPIPNTIPITAFDSHFSNGWGAYGQDEVNVYDGTVIRLREISLGYNLPKTLLSKTPFGGVSISVSGRNLWFNAPNMLDGLNLDPETSGVLPQTNVQGFEYGVAPTTRRYGVNLRLTF